jgi:hypothetical protein
MVASKFEDQPLNIMGKVFDVANATSKKVRKLVKSHHEKNKEFEDIDPMQNYFNKVNKVGSRLHKISGKAKEVRKFADAANIGHLERFWKGLGKDVLDAPLRTGAAVTTMVATPIMVHKAIKDNDKERRKEDAYRNLNAYHR